MHPLSGAVLSELQVLRPSWLDPDRVELDHKKGTFRLPFTLHTPENQAAEGLIATFYDRDSRNHFLMVQFGALTGRVSLTDGSKSAWQSNIGDDLARIPGSVAELVDRIDAASRGEVRSTESGDQASPSKVDLAKKAAEQFPFPDGVRSPNG